MSLENKHNDATNSDPIQQLETELAKEEVANVGKVNDVSGESSHLNVDIGRKIRSARLLLGLTQKTLSKLMNITFQQVQKYEKGANRISASMLWSLSQKLGMDIDYFFPANKAQLYGTSGDAGKVREAKKPFDFDFEINKKDKDSKHLISLIKHFRNLKDPALKKQVLQLVSSMSNLKK